MSRLKMLRLSEIPIAAVGLFVLTAPASAQTAPAATPALGGPVVPGVCLLSQSAVLSNAKVGVAASARLKVLGEQVDAELRAEATALQADAKTFDAQKAKLPAVEQQQRQAALNTRAKALQEKAQLRQREIEATRQKAVGQIAVQAQPVIAAAYTAHGCGLLFDRASAIGGNMANDLTADVVKGLDAKVTTITFERATLPSASAAH